jgi:tRNA pseudouridine synthase 10
VAREVVERARELVLDEGIEFGSFALGLHFEDEALARAGWLERFRSSVKRLAGTALATEWTGRRVDLLRPEATFVYDPRAKKMEARLRSLFLYGRYRKLVRGLPQTRWHCRSCGGNGCAKCRGTGRVVPGSVEESIGEPVARAHRAWGEPLLHGMGREDADVTMLGSGRPFVLEVVSPRRRKVALEEVRVESGVELASPLRVVPGELVTRLKMLDPPKRYRAVCRAEAEIDPSRLPSLLALAGAEIQQRTPGRVQKSRADLVRPRRLLALEARVTGPRELELELTTEAGTYVKELVSGDEGRTSPSVASVLSVPIAVFELTVLEIRIEDEAVLGGESASPYAKPKP